MRKRRTLTDLNEIPGWSKVDNDTSRHEATGVVVERLGMTARPWRVYQDGVTKRRVGGQYSDASNAIDTALTEVFELERLRGIPEGHPVTKGVSLRPAFEVPEVQATFTPAKRPPTDVSTLGRPRVQHKLTWRESGMGGRDLESYEGRFLISPYEDDDRYRYEVFDRTTNTSIDHMFTLDQAKAHCQQMLDQEHNR